MKKHKISAIDVVAILAVIAVIAAIVPPAMTDARARAQEAACMFNMKQIGEATKAYVQDWDDTWPGTQVFQHKYPSLSKDDTLRTGIYCYGGMPTLLLGYTHNFLLFWCPLDPFSTPINDPQLNAQKMSSVAYRLGFVYYEIYSGSALKGSYLARPAQQVVYHECAAFHHGALFGKSGWTYYAWQMRPYVTGQPTLLSTCADGHVALWTERNWGGVTPYDANQFTYCSKSQPTLNDLRDPRLSWDLPPYTP